MVVNLNKQMVTKKLIMNHILDIDVYRFYTNKEVQLGSPMLSPLMKEKKPSFGYFQGESGEICFKDFRLGAGDCIKFVQLLFGLNFFEALSKIVIDFNLHYHFHFKEIGNKIEKNFNTNNCESRDLILKKANNFKLGKSARNWKAYDLAFWQQFGIDLVTLKKYRVQPIKYLFVNGNPIKADKYAYCFIEQKDNRQTIKIYQPFSENYKWLNNHDASVWQGWNQLPKKGKKLIITKSLKDVMSIKCLLDIPAVSLQAEGSNPKEHIINDLKDRFDNIFILYDNDFDKKQNWGQMFSKSLADKYDFINLCIPKNFKSKDFSDLVKNVDKFKVGFSTLEEEFQEKTIKEKINLIWNCNIYIPF